MIRPSNVDIWSVNNKDSDEPHGDSDLQVGDSDLDSDSQVGDSDLDSDMPVGDSTTTLVTVFMFFFLFLSKWAKTQRRDCRSLRTNFPVVNMDNM